MTAVLRYFNEKQVICTYFLTYLLARRVGASGQTQNYRWKHRRERDVGFGPQLSGAPSKGRPGTDSCGGSHLLLPCVPVGMAGS